MIQSPFAPDLLDGQNVLVTGGGTGLGLATAQYLVSVGARVVLWGRRGEVLDRAVEQLAQIREGSAIAQPVDIRDADVVEASMAEAWERSGPVTGVVNNAAANFVAPTATLSTRALRAVTSTVMDGAFHVTTTAGRRWIDEGIQGSVVSMLTTWVWSGSAFVVPSAMAKGAVHAMTMSLAVEWASHGIRLNAVAPGPIPTEFAWDVLDAGREDLVTATDDRGVPLGRHGRPEEVAQLVAYLLSDAAGYITGETIAIDGAQRLAGPATFAALRALDADDWREVQAKARDAAARSKAQRSI